MIPKVTDSAVWRRICSIDQQASILCSLNPSGHLIWDEEADGLFSFKSAYEAVRDHKVSSDVYKNIWESKQELKIKIFQWKIVKGIIPITDKLGRFKQIRLFFKSKCTLNHGRLAYQVSKYARLV
ncbi:unnamed protein product, partial [Cuscuta epithymum]